MGGFIAAFAAATTSAEGAAPLAHFAHVWPCFGLHAPAVHIQPQGSSACGVSG